MTFTKRRRWERGGAAAIVAVLLGGGVLLGMLSLSLDVGRVLVEKRQLQNGADAAAQSLATDCWKSPASCRGTGAGAMATRAATLANGNASDGTTTIVSACSVNIPGSPINGCPATVNGFAECAALPPVYASMAGLPYVEVRTRTRTTSGGSALTNFVAGALGANTTSVGACARSAVGNAEGNGDVPITFSACDWQHATGGTTGGGGGSYYPSPVYSAASPKGYGGAGSPPWPLPAATPPAQLQGQEVILLAQNPPGGATMPTGCSNWNGHALPGGFGILETTSNPCTFVEYPHHWMHTSTGNNTGCDLSALVGKVINLPIFDCTADYAPGVAPPVGDCLQGNGNNAYYHRVGYAQFYLSGYSLNVTVSGVPNKVKSLVSGQFPCNGGDRCISGWFLAGSLSATAITGPPGGAGSFGLTSAVPAG